MHELDRHTSRDPDNAKGPLDVHKNTRDPTNSELRRALALALTYLAPLEPPDSRAVSNEFVAMAAMIHGETTDEAVAIIDCAMRAASE